MLSTKTKVTGGLIGFAAIAGGASLFLDHPRKHNYSDSCLAIDGDTVHCNQRGQLVRLRLNGIDAPELGSSRAAVDSHASLRQLVQRRRVYWVGYKQDRYGRTVARVQAGKLDLSCAQLAKGHAVYVPRWDERKALAGSCSSARGG